jgi:uncharacterized protein
MKQNRLYTIVVILLLIVASGWIGESAKARDKEFIKIGGGATGGTLLIIASGMCNLINENIKWLDASAETGGSVQNARRVGTKRIKLGLVMCDTAVHAIKGGPEFKDERYPDIRALFSGHMSYWHMITLEKSGIKTINDLKGKKVAIGYPGSAVEAITREILKEYDLIPDRDFKKFLLTHTELVEALKDDTIDAGAIFTGIPTGVLLDLGTTHKMRLLPVSPDMQDKIVKKFPYYFKDNFKPGIYPGVKENIPALTIGSHLITYKDVDDEFAYAITKLLAENTKTLGEVHPIGYDWSLETVKKGFVIPVHPGALKYFNEKGITFK